MNDELLKSYDNASRVFVELLKKLEEDQYISGPADVCIYELLMDEMHALAVCLSSNKPLSVDDNGEAILPGGFLVLCRFDLMAQEYSGAFWQKLHVDNPGRLTEMYLELLEADVRILLGDVQKENYYPNAYIEAVEKMKLKVESPYFD